MLYMLVICDSDDMEDMDAQRIRVAHHGAVSHGVDHRAGLHLLHATHGVTIIYAQGRAILIGDAAGQVGDFL